MSPRSREVLDPYFHKSKILLCYVLFFMCIYFRFLHTLMSSPSPRSLSLPSQERCSSPLIIFMALSWTLSSMSMSLMHWTAQSCKQYSSCGLTWKMRGRITSFNELATLHSRKPLAFFAAVAHCCLLSG